MECVWVDGWKPDKVCRWLLTAAPSPIMTGWWPVAQTRGECNSGERDTRPGDGNHAGFTYKQMGRPLCVSICGGSMSSFRTHERHLCCMMGWGVDRREMLLPEHQESSWWAPLQRLNELRHKSNDHQSLNVTIISSNFINTIYASRPPNAFNMFCVMIVLSAKIILTVTIIKHGGSHWSHSALCVVTP